MARSSSNGRRFKMAAPQVSLPPRPFTDNDRIRLAGLGLRRRETQDALEQILPHIRMIIGSSVVVADVKLFLETLLQAAGKFRELLTRLRDAELNYVQVARTAYGWERYFDEHTVYVGDDEVGRELVFHGDDEVSADDLFDIVDADIRRITAIERAVAAAWPRDQGRVRSADPSWIGFLDRTLRNNWQNLEPDVAYPFRLARDTPFAELAGICYAAAMGLTDEHEFMAGSVIRAALAKKKRAGSG